MNELENKKVIIVEGITDKKKVQKLLKEEIDIICTYGTIGISKLDDLIESLIGKDVFILVDADASGEKLRKQFKRELPEANHLYIDRKYREVAEAPDDHLASILLSARFEIQEKYLKKG